MSKHTQWFNLPYCDDHGYWLANSTGIVVQMAEPAVTRVEDAPGHMELDRETGLLYIADTGGGRLLWLDTTSSARPARGTSSSPSTAEA